jgi:hypothetical protein
VDFEEEPMPPPEYMRDDASPSSPGITGILDVDDKIASAMSNL